MSGRKARTFAEGNRVVAECRRFIRFSTRSSPACSDRCRCGISRDIVGDEIAQLVVGLDESIEDDMRRRFSSGTWREDLRRPARRASARPAGPRHSS
jgi:hypothetical protein